MSGIINGFLNMARLESGKFELNLQRTELRQLIESTIADFRVLNAGVEIVLEDANAIYIDLDKEKIEHVLVNLMSNAVKYSKRECL
ncbi:sensor histidine kinase [Mucilaginibacter antarcticus]|uniref:sensor histidine kinase n=1 Tax=Mucilaginibacter antarcticus TaxID=1855725 RepID=UPI00364423F7